MSMRYGPRAASAKDGLGDRNEVMPYEDLPEVEKAYDRDTALGTLKLICKLGFKITKE